MAPIRTAVLIGFAHQQRNLLTGRPTMKKQVFNPRNPPLSSNSMNFRYKPRPFDGMKIPNSKRHASPTILNAGTDIQSVFYMSLLALQFACQPILTKRFTPKTVNRSTVVFSQDFVKIILAYVTLLVTGGWSDAVKGWSVRTWLSVAGIPASLYCIQNLSTLVAYQNLPPLTFNVLNQTKTLSAAVFCYLLMGKVQSKIQILSLILLFTSSCIIEKLIPFRKSKNSEATKPTKSEEKKNVHGQGVIAVLLASLISGLAGALTQKSLQSHGGGRNSYLFTIELSFASLIIMSLSMLRSSDGERIRSEGFFNNWTPSTLIPIFTNAAGGIIVGLVTKYAGAVKKGFALIFGLLLSGLLQVIVSNNDEDKIEVEQILGGLLAAASLWLYNSFPAL